MSHLLLLARRVSWKTVVKWLLFCPIPRVRQAFNHLYYPIWYTRDPQGFLSSGDRYNRWFASILSTFQRAERCVDDSIYYDENLESHWWRTIDFLSLFGSAGIVINRDKYQFCQREVDFAGFRITPETIEQFRMRDVLVRLAKISPTSEAGSAW